MTSIIEEAEIINKYLCNIKKNLPIWLRLRKDELNDTLDEIEEHIWEKAIEIAGNKEPNDIDVQIAIAQMGDPQDIARRFAIGSTPYLYISEELYPLYRKYRKVFVWSFLLWLTIFVFPNPFIQFPFYQASELSLFFFEIVISVLAILTTLYFFIGIVFCYLSISGYFPYKLRNYNLLKVDFDNYQIQKPKFSSSLHLIILVLEMFFILVNGIFLILNLFYLFIPFLIIPIKFSRVLIKRRSIVWQRALILLETILVGWMVRIVVDILCIMNYFMPSEISYFLSIIFFIYICYEIYIYITFRERVEFYLKKLSLIKRINKKQRILIDIRKKDVTYTQNNKSNGIKYKYDFEKKIGMYLKEVRKKLPIWLKFSEKQAIVKDIETEIRDNLLEFEDPSNLTESNLKEVFSSLGSIETRISEYKQQRTPKIYISKELWSWYLKVIKATIVYFILISGYILVLQLSFNAFIDFNSVFVYFSILWLIFISVIILTTKIFTFFSLNDLVPRNSELFTLSKIKVKIKYILFIWELIFSTLYIVFGSLFLFYEFIPLEFNINRSFILICVTTNLFLLLGTAKAFKVIFKGNKTRSFLIILCIVLSLLLSFLDLYNYHLDYRFVHSSLSLNIFELVFIPINIELIYEVFQYFIWRKINI